MTFMEPSEFHAIVSQLCMTKEEFLNFIGVNEAYMQQWASGERPILERTALRLRDALRQKLYPSCPAKSYRKGLLAMQLERLQIENEELRQEIKRLKLAAQKDRQ
jgi:DNA-binding transcriptional regulator YdaS (Cro superfamily)